MEKEKVIETLCSIFKSLPLVKANCLTEINAENLQEFNCLVCGNDTISLTLAKSTKAVHSFYSSYYLDMDVWKYPKETDYQLFHQKLKDVHLIGKTLFLGHFEYLKVLQQVYPNLVDKFLLYIPKSEEDCIKQMVDLSKKDDFQ